MKLRLDLETKFDLGDTVVFKNQYVWGELVKKYFVYSIKYYVDFDGGKGIKYNIRSEDIFQKNIPEMMLEHYIENEKD